MTAPAPTFLIRFRRNTAANWEAKNPILASGEPAYERDTGKYKIGDGVTTWSNLPYFVPQVKMPDIADLSPSEALIYEHVYANEPHPAYDDAPSLVLLYQNAKV